MKFYYSIIIFLLTSYLLFFLYCFLIPAPALSLTEKLIPSASTPTTQETKINETINNIGLIKNAPLENIYYFPLDLQAKKYDAIFLYVILTFIILIVLTIIFHKKTHVLFPIICSIIGILLVYSSLWEFTYTIPMSLYLDIEQIRFGLSNITYLLKIVGPFIFLEIILIMIGYWYKFP